MQDRIKKKKNLRMWMGGVGGYLIPKSKFFFLKKDILIFTMTIHCGIRKCIHKLINTKTGI